MINLSLCIDKGEVFPSNVAIMLEKGICYFPISTSHEVNQLQSFGVMVSKAIFADTIFKGLIILINSLFYTNLGIAILPTAY
jgi:hypothetical protein